MMLQARLLKKNVTKLGQLGLIQRYSHNESIFQSAKHGNFYQQPVQVANPFDADPFMQRYVKLAFGSKPTELAVVQSDLSRLGNRIATDVHELALECERHQPTLEQFDCWGRRVDRIHTSHAWKEMKAFSAEQGFIAIAYPSLSNGGGVVSNARLHQMLKNLLYAPSSGLYGCPLAMTDGAAKTLQLLQKQKSASSGGMNDCLTEAYERLTTRDPNRFWTSGQWMTERGGGSDVGDGTETIAIPQGDGSYRLHGFKWFSSATDSDMTLALARVVPTGGGQPTAGSRGLSLFFVRVRDPNHPDLLNGIQVVRLKNKLGTKQLPTAELLLDGCEAQLIGEPGRGVAEISTMLQLTRLHNAVHAAGALRRFSQLCRDHARQRKAFGRRISQYPLHVRGLADLEVNSRAACLFAMNYAAALGRTESANESDASDDDRQLVRLLSPLLKLFTAKQAVRQAQEAMEMFGGVGYIEESGIPGMLRDANVLPIWEGTTNVLSLDLLRALKKSSGAALPAFLRTIESACAAAAAAEGSTSSDSLGLSSAVERLGVSTKRALTAASRASADRLAHAAREFAYSLSRIHSGAQLLAFAAATRHPADVAAARRWCLNSDLDQFARVAEQQGQSGKGDQLLCAEDERRVVYEDFDL